MTSERAPSADLRARVLAEVARTPSPTRVEYKRRVLLVAGIGAVATVALFVGMGGMSPGMRPVEMIAFTVGFALVAVAVLTRLSSRSGASPSMLAGRAVCSSRRSSRALRSSRSSPCWRR